MNLDFLENGKTLTKAEQRIADYIVSDPSKFLLTPINVVAEELGISEATMSRFVRHVGFTDYKEFKKHIAAHADFSGPAVKMHNTIADDLNFADWFERQSAYLLYNARMIDTEVVERAVHMIKDAQHVYIFGRNSSRSLATMLEYRLRRIGKHTVLLTGDSAEIIEGMANITENDLVIYFAFGSLSLEAKTILANSKELHYHTLAITSRNHFSNEKAEEEIVVYRGQDKEYHSQATVVVLIDAIVLSLSRSPGSKAMETLSRIQSLKKKSY